MTASLRARRSKRFYRDREVMVAGLADRQSLKAAMPPWWIRLGVEIRSATVGGTRCVSITPPTSSGARVLHLHGGAFVEQPEHHHWRFLRWLALTTGASVVVPLYPLCPIADHDAIRRCVRRVYDDAIAGHPGPVVVSGDSAGGLLAVELARTAPSRGARRPDALVLSSPWLDLAITDGRSERIEPDDPELAIAGLRTAGRWYSGGGRGETDPLSTDLSALPPTAVASGTRDVLNPDAERLHKVLTTAGVAVTMLEYPDMFHNWIMHAIPEGAAARTRLVDFLRGLGVASPATARLRNAGSFLV
ncbi:alpha/beta hydrolase [Tsukamurella ocularis]|uniref:alpha/beta hydrolase n=1 Tax=Tsukamurella ocularis TaxID=1970234 RepID=UPI0039EE6D8F